MRKHKSLDREYFEGLYRKDADPWKFALSPYEQAKYDQTVLALGDEPVQRGLEIGCSIGVLTQQAGATVRTASRHRHFPNRAGSGASTMRRRTQRRVPAGFFGGGVFRRRLRSDRPVGSGLLLGR